MRTCMAKDGEEHGGKIREWKELDVDGKLGKQTPKGWMLEIYRRKKREGRIVVVRESQGEFKD